MVLEMRNMKVGEIVAKNIKYAEIFYKHNIDFCCKGNQTLEVAAKAKNADTDEIIKELQAFSDNDNYLDYKNMSNEKLIRDIIDTHHTYIRENSEMIKELLNKISNVHGVNHPELITIESLFNDGIEVLTNHMINEEEKLFPIILSHAKSGNASNDITSENLMNRLKEEHINEGERFERIAELSNNFNPPDDACNTYKFALNKLDEFQKDLHRHIHKENNILFLRMQEV